MEARDAAAATAGVTQQDRLQWESIITTERPEEMVFVIEGKKVRIRVYGVHHDVPRTLLLDDLRDLSKTGQTCKVILEEWDDLYSKDATAQAVRKEFSQNSQISLLGRDPRIHLLKAFREAIGANYQLVHSGVLEKEHVMGCSGMILRPDVWKEYSETLPMLMKYDLALMQPVFDRIKANLALANSRADTAQGREALAMALGNLYDIYAVTEALSPPGSDLVVIVCGAGHSRTIRSLLEGFGERES